MNQHTRVGFVDAFCDDPNAAILMLRPHQIAEILGALLANIPVDVKWIDVVHLAENLPTQEERLDGFRQIIRAAHNALRRTELLEAIQDYGSCTDDETPYLPHFEAAVKDGVFDEVIARLSHSSVLAIAQGSTLARPVVTAYSAMRIQHFLDNGDIQRGFDALVQSTTLIPNWRPPMFAKWVERVWQAHRNNGLVAELSDDPTDWRNNARTMTLRFGIARTGGITTKPRKPMIGTLQVNVPLVGLWGCYQRRPTEAEKTATRSLPRLRPWNNTPEMVNNPGNMLRDMAWYWHSTAKERKLRKFCADNGLEYPDPAGT